MMIGNVRLGGAPRRSAVLVAVIATLFVIASLMACPARSYASELVAASTDSSAGALKVQAVKTYVLPCTTSGNGYFAMIGEGSIISPSNVKSSDERVATAYAADSGIRIFTNKAGKAKITYKTNGKKASFNVVVKKWVNPMKSFKVGSSEYAKGFKSDWAYFYNSTRKLLTGKVSIKPAAGWELTSLVTHKKTELGDFPQPYGEDLELSNGAKVKNRVWILAYFKNSKTGLEERVQLAAYPWGA